jgi:hypothetical protein
MGSFQTSKTSFNEADLSELEWVLGAVLESLETTDEDTKTILRSKLFLLACNGISDPEKLRDRLMASAKRIRAEEH